MQLYIIDKEKDGSNYNEVHTISCFRKPLMNNQIELGVFSDAIEAVAYAKRIGYSDADGCYYCSSEAHKE